MPEQSTISIYCNFKEEKQMLIYFIDDLCHVHELKWFLNLLKKGINDIACELSYKNHNPI